LAKKIEEGSPLNTQDSKLLPTKNSVISEVEESASKVKRVSETYADGSHYEGEVVNGLRQGNGVFHFRGGGYYDGNWVKGKIEGNGNCISQRSNCLRRRMENERFNGVGVLYNDKPDAKVKVDYNNFEDIEEGWIKYEVNLRMIVRMATGCAILQMEANLKDSLIWINLRAGENI